MGLIERCKNLSTPAKVLSGVVGVAVVGVAGAALVGSGVVGGVATAATAAAGVLLKGGNSQGKESLYTPGRKPIAVSSDSVPDDCRGEYRILDSQNDVKYVGVVASEKRSLQDRI